MQTGAPKLSYSRPRQNVTKLEDQIKKFICGKFEEERITQVKKTTNWNINISADLRRVLAAADEVVKEYKPDVAIAMDPTEIDKRERQGKRRGRKTNS